MVFCTIFKYSSCKILSILVLDLLGMQIKLLHQVLVLLENRATNNQIQTILQNVFQNSASVQMMQGWFIVYQSCRAQLLQILILLMNFECIIVIIIFKVNTQS